eukprot:gnl/MRDRNA2_/MRDRNA2_147022_c0_seq1.p1 gnl/MRDRNA2_/MRDRNA2_147022_c0~~gnl/MRDRNA2_/MRDRNA2_147022_c0_seq1.p1  ORF type:complete len:1054 (+),score=240.64 gnl/MRDRNA2_/MRDRNA2_147022_c0_seq1:187-3162(+)
MANAKKDKGSDRPDSRIKGELPYNPELPPVVLVPPLTGSKLFAKTRPNNLKNPLCKLPFSNMLWPVDKENLVGALVGCWQEEMGIEVDVAASKRENKEITIEPPGVHVYTTNYGDPSEGLTPTYEPFIPQLRLLGYRENKNLFGVPYDWRRGPASWYEHDWPILKQHIEKWVAESGGRPAIFISLSMGGPYFAAFLLHAAGVDAAWKKKHVAAYITMSGPFGGTIAAMGMSIWGSLGFPANDFGKREGAHEENPYQSHLQQQIIKSLLHGFGSIAWLIPPQISARARSLIQLPEKWKGNITTQDLPAVLSLVSPELYQLYELAQRFPTMDHPGVKVYCMYGTKLQGPALYRYTEKLDVDFAVTDADKMKVAVKMAQDKLKSKGINAGGLGGEKAQESIASLFSKAAEMVGHTTTTAAPKQVPTPPPDDAAVGSDTWISAAADLIRDAIPVETDKTEGDGLVEHESLAVCDKWRDVPGLPDTDVRQMPGVHHGAESRKASELLYVRQVVAEIAGISNPNITETPGAMDMGDSKCEHKKDECPQLDNGDECTGKAMSDRLNPKDTCCVQAWKQATCMGDHCWTEMVGNMALGDPEKVLPIIDKWYAQCNATIMPPKQGIKKYVEQKQMEKMEASLKDPKCEPKQEKCPKVENGDECNEKAMAGQLKPEESCCGQALQQATCMGQHCWTEMIGNWVLKEPRKVKPLINKWYAQCNASLMPPKRGIWKYVRKTKRKIDKKGSPFTECLGKMPGRGCPKAADDCNERAIKGLLRPEDECCTKTGEMVKCMGDMCFAGMMVTMGQMAGSPDAVKQEAFTKAWEDGCPNVKFPTKAIESMRKQSLHASDVLKAAPGVMKEWLDNVKAKTGKAKAQKKSEKTKLPANKPVKAASEDAGLQLFPDESQSDSADAESVKTISKPPYFAFIVVGAFLVLMSILGVPALRRRACKFFSSSSRDPGFTPTVLPIRDFNLGTPVDQEAFVPPDESYQQMLTPRTG